MPSFLTSPCTLQTHPPESITMVPLPEPEECPGVVVQAVGVDLETPGKLDRPVPSELDRLAVGVVMRSASGQIIDHGPTASSKDAAIALAQTSQSRMPAIAAKMDGLVLQICTSMVPCMLPQRAEFRAGVYTLTT